MYFESEPQIPVSKKAEHLVDRLLRLGLRDGEIEQAIRYACEVDDEISEDEIRDEVLAKRSDVLDRLALSLESWREADARLTEAEEDFGLGISKAQFATETVVTVLAAIVGVAISVALSELVFWGFSFLAIAIIGYAAIRIYATFQNLAIRSRNLSLPDRKRALTAAKRRFEFAAENQATVAIREAINERLTSFSTEFCILDDRGLRALADPEREVSTAASDALTTQMASLSGGSIGISGPRGVGKTTLIDSFTQGRSVPLDRERIGLVVSAPVKYDAKEFVLYLFASLCERALRKVGVQTQRYTSFASLRERRGAQLVSAFGIAVVAMAGTGIAMLVFNKTAPDGPRETGYVLLAVAGLLGLLWLELRARFRPTKPTFVARLQAEFAGEDPLVSPDDSPEHTTQDLLEQIRFQQSISSGQSGSVTLPLGIGFSAESSITMARTPWSLPEAVDAFRKYAASLTNDHYLVIGIDELDKMGSDDSAREFLNNIKGVFGVSGCYYLVSISDDAMASFERRGLPVRDVFDSSFDAVQRVDYLTLAESRAVLGSRVIGLPVPYQCFCHCMAGGLPRDLIRVTRELVHQAKENKTTSLKDLVHAVMETELRAKRAGAIEVSREENSIAGAWVQNWLDGQGSEGRALADASGLRESVKGLASWRGLSHDSKPSAAAELAFEAATFNYYAATVIELFTGEPEFTDFIRAEPESPQTDPDAVDVLESLTKARQQFAIGPGLAWRSIEAVRTTLELQTWDDPHLGKPIGYDIPQSAKGK